MSKVKKKKYKNIDKKVFYLIDYIITGKRLYDVKKFLFIIFIFIIIFICVGIGFRFKWCQLDRAMIFGSGKKVLNYIYISYKWIIFTLVKCFHLLFLNELMHLIPNLVISLNDQHIPVHKTYYQSNNRLNYYPKQVNDRTVCFFAVYLIIKNSIKKYKTF